jgi:hypothetical protein
MIRFILFVCVAVPLFLGWAAYHAFIKRDFAAIKSDFTVGAVYLLLACGAFYLFSLI